ncbi:hypothetical protein ACHAXR_007247 [Thalassiosira sp. AJA248-18]
MEQMNNNSNINSGSGENSPNPNANRAAMNFDSASAAQASSFGGQMNPMSFMAAQFPGMMGNMPNNMNPQEMMSMMGNFCQTAGPANMGMGAYGNFPGNDGSMPQGMMNPAMAQMMRNNKRGPMDGFGDDADQQPPAAKRGNFGSGSPSGDMPAGAGLDANDDSNHGNNPTTSNPNDEDDDEKPPAAGAGGANSPTPRKDHITVPPSKEGIKFYSRNDVLCGRGGGTNVHPGNRRFRDLINANRRAYLKARKNDKPAISRSIVRTIREMNGRFLKKDEKLGLWFEIGDDGAREKTSQALRQRAPEMRKILFEDEQRVQQQQQQEMMQRHQLMGMGGPGMQGMGPGNFSQMGPGAMGPGNFAAAAASMGGGQQGGMGPGGGGQQGDHLQSSLLAKYNMLHQKNWLAQEKNMILQRLAMSGLNPQQLNQQQNNIENMTTQTLLKQGMKPVTPRGA